MTWWSEKKGTKEAKKIAQKGHHRRQVGNDGSLSTCKHAAPAHPSNIVNAFLKPAICCSWQSPTSAIVSKYMHQPYNGKRRFMDDEELSIKNTRCTLRSDLRTPSYVSSLYTKPSLIYIVDAWLERTSTSTIVLPFHQYSMWDRFYPPNKCTWSLRACLVLRRCLVSSVSFCRSSFANSRLVASDAQLADAWGASVCLAGSPATITWGFGSEEVCTPLVTGVCWDNSASFPEASTALLRAARKSVASRRQPLSTSVKWRFACSVATSARSRPSSAPLRLVRAWRSSPRAAWEQTR